MQVRGLTAALNSSGRFKFKARASAGITRVTLTPLLQNPEYAVDYLVVGGGVIGLAVAQRLAERFPTKSTILVERHDRAGEETSSRNSEVIHAGLYYPPDSLKTRLCLRGRTLMYDRCSKYNVPHKKTGKLVVAREQQRSYIEALHAKAKKLEWPGHSSPGDRKIPVLPTELISGDDARQLEPGLCKGIVAALWSPETGILDSHSFMESLEKDILETDGGELVYSTRVVRVDPHTDEPGWVVQTVTGDTEEGDALLARTLINCAGLSANLILNSLLPKQSRIPMYYARGSYASYRGAATRSVSHLIYPCPAVGKDSHAFHSLGTHLTLDLQGKVRFGPDLEWLSPPDENADESRDPDFWQRHLIPDDSRIELMYEAVKEYLPDITLEGLQPDYCGVRPKLVPPGGGFQDFVFRTDYADTIRGLQKNRTNGGGPMISLLGIESPGLTSSLAIAEMVVDDMLCKEGHVE
ncbi:L-2-hydroxyglutarate dehydrogenase, mitochondrial [Grifola frondosa]|uniref:L-2-hydroxyglutarate dehydrogenase, mitochondrial n=1 Tax=Grifola frondosa TaxID=5627 RepID=A0A1C7MIR1_GRIFR|nr:L-2-hydroxyglutarate dehydrogenase, mitochondrial [Grifola frondosa]